VEIGIFYCAMLVKSSGPGLLPPIIRRFNTVKKEVRKKVETAEKYRDTQREKGNSKIVGDCPWGPKKGPNF